jgi:predicted dehydrogenase
MRHRLAIIGLGIMGRRMLENVLQHPDFEVCGCFGVDSIQNGLCPDGVAYDWNKSSRIGAAKRVRA